MPNLNDAQKKKRGELLQQMFDSIRERHPRYPDWYIYDMIEQKLNDPKALRIINAMAASAAKSSNIDDGSVTNKDTDMLREYIRNLVIKEMNATGAVSLNADGGGTGVGAGIQTPRAFKGKGNKKNPGAILGMKPVKSKRSKLFEDVINKAGFDIKFSDQGKELMDYIQGSEKFKDDLHSINELFEKMREDGTFTKEEAFNVYKEFVERASRQYIKDMNQNIPADEYFLRKDLLDVIYYNLSKIETPQSGAPSDNIDGEPVPPSDNDSGDDSSSFPRSGGGGNRSLSFPPEGGEGETPPEGEVGDEESFEGDSEGDEDGGEEAPPEDDESPGTKTPPKPEDIREMRELKQMINEIYSEIGFGDGKKVKESLVAPTSQEIWRKYHPNSKWHQTLESNGKKIYASVRPIGDKKYLYIITDRFGLKLRSGEESTMEAAKQKVFKLFKEIK